MDLAGLMRRLLEIERAAGCVEPVELRRMVVATQLYLLEMQRHEIDRVAENQSLQSRPALLYQMYGTQVKHQTLMLCPGEPSEYDDAA